MDIRIKTGEGRKERKQKAWLKRRRREAVRKKLREKEEKRWGKKRKEYILGVLCLGLAVLLLVSIYKSPPGTDRSGETGNRKTSAFSVKEEAKISSRLKNFLKKEDMLQVFLEEGKLVFVHEKEAIKEDESAND